MKRWVSYLDDALMLAGCGCVVYGLSLLSAPAAWILGGIMLIGLAVLVGMRRV